jgi:trans-aconitate methyltransferase
MLRQAMKRNAAAIERGTEELHLGTIESLPGFDKPFDKIFSANVVQFWNDPVAVFHKLHGMLSDGGIIATTYMPRHRGASAADAQKKALEIVNYLKTAGYNDVRIEEKHMAPIPAICVLATK